MDSIITGNDLKLTTSNLNEILQSNFYLLSNVCTIFNSIHLLIDNCKQMIKLFNDFNVNKSTIKNISK